MTRVLLAALLLSASIAFAQDKPCSPAEASTAEKVVDRVVNWTQLYKAYQDYRHCDTGPVAEGFTEALMRCMVEWKQMDGLAKPMDQDKDYNAFVMKHLRSAGPDDQKAVYSRAKMSCPKGLDGFCTTLTDAARPPAAFKGIEIAPMPTFNEPAKK